jgi:hypothetical protein
MREMKDHAPFKENRKTLKMLSAFAFHDANSD